jgi:NitT/TauT family transport system substrate-binding protein
MRRAPKFACLVLSSLVASAGVLAPSAYAADKKITFSLSDQMRVPYYWLYLPKLLGYWEQEGLDVDVQSVGGSLEALQQVMAGNADYGQMGALSVVQASAKGMPMQVVMMNGTFQWKLAVPADSPIQSVSELKGKSIGVFSASTNGNDFLKAYLKQQGLDPDSDVTLLPVGAGASAIEAMRKGEVAALYYWPSAFVSYEGQGLSFRYFQAPEWAGYPDYSVAASKAVVNADPAVTQAMVRAMAKATVFAEANPNCAVKMFWKAYPDSIPTGVAEDKALDSDTKMLVAQLEEGNAEAEKLGAVTAEQMKSLQDFMLSAKMVEKQTDPATLVVEAPDFFSKVNDFDKDAIKAAAKACKI